MPENTTTLENRSVGQAMWRGALCRCPHCGQGKMFRAYLKVADQCNVCGEELSHHRADDFPPYIAITIVGHIIIFLMLHMDMTYHVQPITYLLTMIPLSIVLCLALLPPIKGSIVGLQWAARMYGFGAPSRAD
ncbi:DUF983 domain-containing protein [Devosia sp. BK]|jgi:uncharacterized protein (DUF983 family)|uniref:DUF983 domain-containing protein n=1 Tax=unclassified Devosia TaxID=196773 RepID=UPI000712D56B|nr:MULTISPECIES: DUF983 domain-containing protein [unclassified Devosia]KQN74136.1 hypothetical protein ASE94_03805 [Devosia sp. Leaf64]KQT44973.1 hypothetical protein ASG47_16250 [Devosia sp. Leaf420]MDV3250617.1 DUF983 domain-containing protein [Devosia sp. BK]